MEKLLNNAFFWQKIDTLVLSLEYEKKRSVGDKHPEYHNLIYPLEYGYLIDQDTQTGVVTKMFKGTDPSKRVDAIIVCVDILQKGFDIKLLLGCSEQEKLTCLEFLNQTPFQKTILVNRSDDLPNWAIED